MNHLPDELTLSHNTVLTAAADQLRRLILTRQLKPGDRLVQHDLAVRLGVSRTPIREALQQLAKEGLVTISPYRGATVAALSPLEIEAIYHVRIALEAYGARLVARNITDAEIEVLGGVLAEMGQVFASGDPDTLLEVNRRFYFQFYRATRQQRLYEMIMNHLDLSRQYRLLHFYLRDLSFNTIEWHEALLDAVRRHDEDAAERLTYTGLESVAEGLIRSLQEGEMQDKPDSHSRTNGQKEG